MTEIKQQNRRPEKIGFFKGNQCANTKSVKLSNKNRFTIIELLVVIAIIAILASLLLPALQRQGSGLCENIPAKAVTVIITGRLYK